MSEWKEARLGDICTIIGRIGFRGYTIRSGFVTVAHVTYVFMDKAAESIFSIV